MAFPKTLDELRAAGYKFLEHRKCIGNTCNQQIEFWQTPKGKKIPLDVDAKGNVEPHFSSCPDVKQFR